ncbi:Transcription factor COE1 [Linnemannia hyalina]|uniref:Transcription factor COE1 n=1 Tax=Linnemannia hyalina TaxID=64524 RepID=A0A9P8BQ87_9FUNG|nr:Transcription factor COE1 [Linnemannia hyalina]
MSADDFITHYQPPSFFTLFPDALAVVIRHLKFSNETLAILALVNHECYLTAMPVLWSTPRLDNSLVYTPLQCIQSILTSMEIRSLRPETRLMIHSFDLSQVQETLYCTLPDNWLFIILQHAPMLQNLCLSGKTTTSPFVRSQAFRKLAQTNLIHTELKHLDLSDCTDIREPVLKSMTTHFPNLVSLNLSRTSGVTDTALALIVDRCQYLETVNIAYCRQVTDLGLFSVAKFCRRNLRVLHLTGNLKMTDASLLAVAKHCPRIEKLFLGECSRITDSALEWIARSCSSTSLKELELHRCDKIMFGLPLLELLANKCNVLERLTLTYKQINSRRDDLKLVMEAFRDFHRLQSIDIYEMPEHSPALFFWDLAFQASRGKLKAINLYRGSFMTDYILGNYATAPEYGQNISDQSVRKFNDMRNGAHKATVNLFVDDFY